MHTHSQTASHPPTPLKLLFICTHNRCRSIIAEALANHIGNDLIQAASAGSEPAGSVHPLTLENLQRHAIPVTGLYSKSWDELESFTPDFVITVCDNAAAEACPLWLGCARKISWGLSDPSALSGDTSAASKAFDEIIMLLTRRLHWLREGVEQRLKTHELELLIRTLANTEPFSKG